MDLADRQTHLQALVRLVRNFTLMDMSEEILNSVARGGKKRSNHVFNTRYEECKSF
jgi:hypothetical protein